jgi:hypothetical protein
MKLLNDIIKLLTSEGTSLNEALLKTKVLLHQIGHTELVGWVSSELVGYDVGAQLPLYRTLSGTVFGRVTNGYLTYNRHQIPILHFGAKHRKMLEEFQLPFSLNVLESFIEKDNGTNKIARPIAPEFNQILGERFTDGYFVQSAWLQIEITQVRQVLTEVRTRLLDFVLTLQEQVGATVSDEDIRERTTKLDIQSMLGKSVFGDNATFIIGDNNHQNVINNTTRHNAVAMADELRKHNVDETDIAALQAAISEDPAPAVPEGYGPAVRGWITRMMTKAGDTSWKISISAAGGVLATVLKNYYGL